MPVLCFYFLNSMWFFLCTNNLSPKGKKNHKSRSTQSLELHRDILQWQQTHLKHLKIWSSKRNAQHIPDIVPPRIWSLIGLGYWVTMGRKKETDINWINVAMLNTSPLISFPVDTLGEACNDHLKKAHKKWITHFHGMHEQDMLATQSGSKTVLHKDLEVHLPNALSYIF